MGADLSSEVRRWWTGPVPANLEEQLVDVCARARAAHPVLAIDPFALVAAIAKGAGDDLEDHLARCHVDELALAIAARDGIPGAIEQLERDYAQTIDAACRRFGDDVDDLRQILRTKLFVGTPPRIADYDGRGSLANWLRVIATREFIDLTRRKDRPRERAASEYELSELLSPTDLQLAAIKKEYRDAVIAAMHESVRELDSGDRHLLRQHLQAGLTFDQLATVLDISRATVARRIARAKERIVQRSRELVAARLRLTEQELAEIFDLVRSQLDLSFSTLLATPRPHG